MPIKNNGVEISEKRLDMIKRDSIEQMGVMWDAQKENWLALLNSGDDKEVVLSFSAKLNFKATAPKVKVALGFGKRYSDSRDLSYDADDELQIQIPGTAREELNGHTQNGVEHGDTDSNGVANGDITSDTPAAYKARHPEQFEGEPRKKKKSKAKSKKQSA